MLWARFDVTTIGIDIPAVDASTPAIHPSTFIPEQAHPFARQTRRSTGRRSWTHAVNAGGGFAMLLNTATLGLSNAGYAPPGSTTISPVSGVTVGTGLFGTIGAPLQ